MIDQATELRKLVLRSMRENPLTGGPPPRLVALVGGKGGVGVTSTAVNLAVALADQGLRLVLVDIDPDRSDVAQLCGLSDPNGSTPIPAHRDIHEAIRLGPAGIQVVAALGRPGVSGQTDLGHERLLRQLQSLGRHADLVIVDLGSSGNDIVRSVCAAADDVLVVTTPDSVAVMDTYARIKTSLADLSQTALRLVVNLADTPRSAGDVFERLRQSCNRFLGRDLRLLGQIPHDTEMAYSSSQGVPLALSDSGGPVAAAVQAIAQELMHDDTRSRQNEAA